MLAFTRTVTRAASRGKTSTYTTASSTRLVRFNSTTAAVPPSLAAQRASRPYDVETHRKFSVSISAEGFMDTRLGPSSNNNSSNSVSYRSFATDISRDELATLVHRSEEGSSHPHAYTLFDVREPHELENGKIRTSINIPLSEFDDAFVNLSKEQFQAKYGCSKPEKSSHVIIHCRSGVRSLKSIALLESMGYTHVRNYKDFTI